MVLAVIAPIALAGCMPDGLGTEQRIEEREVTEEFRLADVSRAFVHVPDALILVERNLGSSIEQQLSLPNRTTVRGDNVLMVRARSGRETNVTLLQLNEVLERMGGVPDPFDGLRESDLNSGTDSLGSFVFAERRIGADTICVLGLRRMTHASRPLPRGADAIDVMLRNCVRGTRAEALAPLSAERLSMAAVSAIDPRAPGFLTLSPHAAPSGSASRR
jgi:hypothetical protein